MSPSRTVDSSYKVTVDVTVPYDLENLHVLLLEAWASCSMHGWEFRTGSPGASGEAFTILSISRDHTLGLIPCWKCGKGKIALRSSGRCLTALQGSSSSQVGRCLGEIEDPLSSSHLHMTSLQAQMVTVLQQFTVEAGTLSRCLCRYNYTK